MEIDKSINFFTKLSSESIQTLGELKICFCIDNSGSTSKIFANINSYLDVEINFVREIVKHLKYKPKYISWETIALNISNLINIKSGGATNPSSLFEDKKTYQTILNSNVMFILTDGQIIVDEVNKFGLLMNKCGAHLQAVIGVIVDRRTNKKSFDIKNPAEINTSVLNPAMISNSCILFYNLKNIYVMWSSGVFLNTWKPHNIKKNSTWNDITTISFESICNTIIPTPNIESHSSLIKSGFISFGNGLYFNPDEFLKSKPNIYNIMHYPFNQICQHFKIMLKYEKLYTWFNSIKNDYISKTIHDTMNKIKSLISDSNLGDYRPENKDEFIKNRNLALMCKYINKSNVDVDDFIIDVNINSVIKFIRHMTKIIGQDVKLHKTSNGYSAFNTSRSRYESFSDNDSENSLDYNSGDDLDYDLNDDLNNDLSNGLDENNSSESESESYSFNLPAEKLHMCNNTICWINNNHNSSLSKHKCHICSKESTPCILVKNKINPFNINLIENNPIDYFYSKTMCDKCASLFCEYPIINQTQCCYIIPIINVDKNNVDSYLKHLIEIINNNTYSVNIEAYWYFIKIIFDVVKDLMSCDNDIVDMIKKIELEIF
ncbi:hypothetical protein QLL95_gp0671 [Cotonvirus japonicus]|uniref:VWFA domain-containing protein n=1 Tax=Cotonvirus japonicus TaxID=2811091 RepID=A0ABM7NTF1_9VIRU|nr:hypothetical protein QLL95_gp0671 [Cotonvirus japonicus]BCS83452.1 hypothetical protein [Cotonvirus japonicus]